MHSIEYLQDKIRQAIEDETFTGKPDELYQPIRYILSLGGKRMRPLLTLLACDLFGGDIEEAIYPAIALELFHNFTLIHDDIMDKAPLRRGKKTVSKKWNENIAILSGDTMLALAYDHLININKNILTDVIKVFNKTAMEVCEGQQFDMNFETQPDVSISDYLNMIRLKTAVLFGTSLKIGAIIAETNAENLEHIYLFGVNMGIAFQLMDDYLDVFGDAKKFGKKTGGDIITNKKTYLYLKAFETADDNTCQKLFMLFNNPGIDNRSKVTAIKKIFLELDIDKATEKEMNKYYELAMLSLDSINEDESRKEILRSFAKKLINRDH
jgi:geranylgeranyl diphosphate synthase type II